MGNLNGKSVPLSQNKRKGAYTLSPVGVGSQGKETRGSSTTSHVRKTTVSSKLGRERGGPRDM